MSPTLRDYLTDGRVHVLDGAMGTVLYARGVFVNVCYDELSVTQPELVRDVHESYVRAGAEIIETNTFGANPVKLSSYGLDERTEELNRAAVDLARQAASGTALVVGAIGPLGIRIEPWGPTAREEAEEFFARQVTGLSDGGVDGFILETFADLDEVQAAYRAVRRLSDRPVIVQMTVGEDGTTAYGTPIETIAQTLNGIEPDAVGLNCSVGPAAMLDALERLADHTELPISAQPNAGLPRAVDGRKIYLASPEYMAQYARRLIDAGARFIGGCCGTTPDHVKQIHDYVASVQPRSVHITHDVEGSIAAEGKEPPPLGERSKLGRKLETGEFVVSVEFTPPRGWKTDRMGALATAQLIERHAELETILHYTCRDRNMLGMVSDLLGAAALGLRNVLIVTGDPPAMGPYPDSTAVFDIDSIGLTNVLYRLNHGLDPGGSTIGDATRYVIGVAVNQAAADLDREIKRFAWKVDAGAEYAVTQPVFDVGQLRQLLDRTSQFKIPMIAGIWPLTSLRSAELLANEVPGVDVPPAIIERMRRAQELGSDHARAEGRSIAMEVFEAVRPMVNGVAISTPHGNVATVVKLLDALPNRL
jgi:homocysteine S-methyltransferase